MPNIRLTTIPPKATEAEALALLRAAELATAAEVDRGRWATDPNADGKYDDPATLRKIESLLIRLGNETRSIIKP